jgi:DNA-binding MarR family transcriptional regulator
MEEMEKIEKLYPHLVGAMSRLRDLLQEGVDLSYNQYKTLLTIDGIGRCSLNRLSRELGIAASSASEMVDRLERSGLVARETDGADRRSVTITVTPGGRELLQRIQGGVMDNYRRVLARLSPRDRRRLVRALEDLVRTVGKGEEPSHE